MSSAAGTWIAARAGKYNAAGTRMFPGTRVAYVAVAPVSMGCVAYGALFENPQRIVGEARPERGLAGLWALCYQRLAVASTCGRSAEDVI